MTSPLPDFAITSLLTPVASRDLKSLAVLLVEAVQAGAAVSFVAPLTLDAARAWWERTIESRQARSVVLIARNDEDDIIGTVQLVPAWAPNQPHRADVVKLLVRRDWQGRGVATALMHAVEVEARRGGFTLLTLDCKTGAPAESLYRGLGWRAVGVIPEYALDPDGTPHAATFFYKAVLSETP